MSTDRPLDDLDRRIIDILQRDGRRAYADIGGEVGISGPSAHERVKKLESRGVIRGYVASIDPRAIGLDVLGFTRVTQAPGTIADDLTGEFERLPEIEECHHVAGRADYLLKIRARDTADLERILHAVQSIRHVFTTETDVVFSTAFERRPIGSGQVGRETDASTPDGPSDVGGAATAARRVKPTRARRRT
jgi:Lrp/AsnC family leucine-responsive transcriptional regulator